MKRQYIFDNHIRFTPSDSTLEYCQEELNTNKPFLLPVPAARLLQTLLERSPELIAKEELLTIVWENYGMKGSMHNLAHYTMILRKAFSNMNMEKRVIVTVHKKGLMINPLLDITLTNESVTDQQAERSVGVNQCEYSPSMSENQMAEPPVNTVYNDEKKFNGQQSNIAERLPDEGGEIANSESAASSHLTDNSYYLSKIKKKILLGFIAGTALVIAAGVWKLEVSPSPSYSEDDLRLLSKVKSCTIYTFNSPTNDSVLIKDIFSKLPLNCERDRIIIYATDAFIGPNVTGKKFHTSLTVCTESKDLNNMNSCVSHYYN